MRVCCALALVALACLCCRAQPGAGPRVTLAPVGEGWARSSVNAAVFRQNSVVTQGNTQYIAFYDGEGSVILAKRRLGATAWEVKKTAYSGNVKDAHNAISIGIDGKGVLHMVWDLHGQALRYVRGKSPGSLDLGEPLPMTGHLETRVTYPQFYPLADGDLLFVYREGSSGDGDVMINRYDVQSDKWRAIAHPLIDGEGQRNAYVNPMAIDSKGGWHVSWIWRETPDVASNHDVCYAYSPDGGKTWRKSTGQRYTLPITAESAEVAYPVPQNSELINQTSMTVDAADRPLIVTYWRPRGAEVPQYHLIWRDGRRWQASQVGKRTTPFRLSGGGTKRIPISRPQVLAAKNRVYVVFRDEERGNGVSVAISEDARRARWRIVDLHREPVGAWEPSYDPVLWKRSGQMHLFLQKVGQGDAETLENMPPQTVSVLQWVP